LRCAKEKSLKRRGVMGLRCRSIENYRYGSGLRGFQPLPGKEGKKRREKKKLKRKERERNSPWHL
jgi:hypothetical protein